MTDSTLDGLRACSIKIQVVVQKIREEERKVLFDQYYMKERDIITGTVQRYNGGNYTINIGKIDTVLTEAEQVKTERFQSHEKIKLYVTEVRDTTRGPRITVSRRCHLDAHIRAELFFSIFYFCFHDGNLKRLVFYEWRLTMKAKNNKTTTNGNPELIEALKAIEKEKDSTSLPRFLM